MTWNAQIVTYVRGLTNDLGPTARNDDETLEQLIVIAAMQVSQQAKFANDYSINVEEVTIIPDPSNDVPFVNLTALKTACMLARSEQRVRARLGLSIKDGPSNIDGRAGAEQTAKWADTICAEYAKAELDYRLGNMQPGKAILGPYSFDNEGYLPSNVRPRADDWGGYGGYFS